VLGTLVAAATASADTMSNIVEKASLDIQPANKAFKQVTIDNPLGDIRIEGWDKTSIRIETRKVAPDEEGLDRLRISLVPNPDGTVRITTTADAPVDREVKPLPRGAVRIDLVVHAPRNTHIEATASAGSLEFNNMDAGGDLDTASGRISVNNVAGGVSTHSVSGATSITTVFGSVDSHTLSSNLDLDSISGEHLIASANHGKIAGRRVRSRDIELTTNDGNVSLEAEAALHGRVAIASMSGDIDVRLRRHNMAIIIRARGQTVAFGDASQLPRPDGWVETKMGQPVNGTLPSIVEMRSRRGTVKLTLVESGD
jgi:DUF4097 and DUF4098 domain-containing protein YvlB